MKHKLLLSISPLALLLPSPVHAQSDTEGLFVLEEIIVTAEKRSESIQDLPVAISAFSGDRLQGAGVNDLQDIYQLAPSTQFGVGLTGNANVTIRGIGSEISNIGAEPGVTISQDGVAFSRSVFFDAELMDVERVEVLRGPQGTISGRNATGGAIQVISKRPTDEFEGEVTLKLGNYDLMSIGGFVSGPIIDGKLTGRIAFQSVDRDGWLKNTLLDEELNGEDKVHVRGSLEFKASENLTALLIVDALQDKAIRQGAVLGGRARADLPSYAEAFGGSVFDFDTREVMNDQRASMDKETLGATLKLTWDISEDATLVSTTGYWKTEREQSFEADGTENPIINFTYLNFDDEQFTQELTLTAQLSDNFDIVFGGLYLDETATEPASFVSEPIGLLAGFFFTEPEQKLESYSVYGQARYTFFDDLRVSVGMRYTHDKKEYFESFLGGFLTGSGDASWKAWTPRFAIDYSLSDDVTVFANVARGFKAGGFNTFNFAPVDVFNPEYVWNYEAGLKAELLDNRVRVGLTGFMANYKDMQQIIFSEAILPNVESAGKSRIKGIEFELDALVSRNLRVDASATYLDAKIRELATGDSLYSDVLEGELHPELGVPLVDGTFDLSGNRLARSPKFQFHIGAEYTVDIASDLEAKLRMDYSHQSDSYFDFYNHGSLLRDAFGVLNASFAIGDYNKGWSLTVFANNLTNEDYYSNGMISTIVPGVPVVQGLPGAPRLYGVSFTKRF